MSTSRTLSYIWVFGFSVQAWCGETGDFDGDGRLSIRDVVLFQEQAASKGLQDLIDSFPPESLQGFMDDPCYKLILGCDTLLLTEREGIASSVYLEALRRGAWGDLSHWHSVWVDPDVMAVPLPGDKAVMIDVPPLTASGGEDHLIDVRFRITAAEPIQAFSIVLESAGLLRPVQILRSDPAWWSQDEWNRSRVFGSTFYDQFWSHGNERDTLNVNPVTFLITGGRLVIEYHLPQGHANGFPVVIETGEHILSLRARLPKGLKTGQYSLSVHPSSEVLLANGKLIAPQAVSESSISVEKDITGGWDEGVPPLQLDSVSRKVLGKTEFRFADSDGKPVEAGPIAAVHPGEMFRFRMQMRTETPLNYFRFNIRWSDGSLQCVQRDVVNLFRSPEDQSLYTAFDLQCGFGAVGNIAAEYLLKGADARVGEPSHPFQPLEYFKPLNQWVDLFECALQVDPVATGGKEIPLQFLSSYPQRFEPYSATWTCCKNVVAQWEYESLVFANATVEVLGDQVPPEVPDLGIRIRLDDVISAGSPGDLIEVPVIGSNKKPVEVFRMVFETNPQVIFIDAFDINSFGDNGWEPGARIPRGATDVIVKNAVCAGRPDCRVNAPYAVSFFSTEDQFVLIDIIPGFFQAYQQETEIGKLIVKVKDVPLGSEILIKDGRVLVDDPGGAGVVLEESGGVGKGEPNAGRFGPANEFRAGMIRVVGFRRGDANADGVVDLSDAVVTLNFLFLSGVDAACRDGADADDNGRLDITDPIALLGNLFLGGGGLPQPYRSCGFDPTADELGCRVTGCR